jgi:pSer/pThr/pTyr-binding forkhead associated (FHA) protein
LPELVDLGSSNGTRINGETITQKLLQVGDLIQIGHTTLKVLEVLGGGGAESNEPEFDASLEGWARTVEKLLLKNRGPEDKLQAPKPFSPPVKLMFRTGTLVGKSLLVGFGPRSIGSECTDILIREPDFEGEAFSLLPQESGEVLFSTTKPEKVLLNKQSTKESPLKDGDFIQVGPNVIEVSIKKKSSSL